MAVLLLPLLLGMVGLVLDIGHAFSGQRKLQATADAAALAGAADLPNAGTAVSTAKTFGATTGAKNALGGGDAVSENVSTKCLSTFPGCTTANAVTVSEAATVNTLFAKVF